MSKIRRDLRQESKETLKREEEKAVGRERKGEGRRRGRRRSRGRGGRWGGDGQKRVSRNVNGLNPVSSRRDKGYFSLNFSYGINYYYIVY